MRNEYKKSIKIGKIQKNYLKKSRKLCIITIMSIILTGKDYFFQEEVRCYYQQQVQEA